MTDRVQLTFKYASAFVGSEEIGLLVLVDKDEERQLVVTVDKNMMKHFQLRMSKTEDTGSFLPEVLVKMIKSSGLLDKLDLEIISIEKGQYQFLLTNIETSESFPLRAGDAILLSYISSLPIYISSSLMRRQSAPHSAQSSAMALPINSISDEMLQNALDKAIENEDYKVASYLRDEINNRKAPNTKEK
nr:bifunctional nuclease family protein [Prevotella sp.]